MLILMFRILIILLFFVSCASQKVSPLDSNSEIELLNSDFQDIKTASPELDAATQLTNMPGVTIIQEVSRSQRQILNQRFYSALIHQGQVTALVVSHDGRTAYSVGKDGYLYQIQLPLKNTSGGFVGSVRKRAILRSDAAISAVSLSPSGKYLAIAQFSRVLVLDTENYNIVLEQTKAKGRISKISWDPFNELIAMGMVDGDVYIWQFQEQLRGKKSQTQYLELYDAAFSPIVGLKFHPLGRSLFVAEQDGVLHLWRILRTEKDLGLWDDSNYLDIEAGANYRASVFQIQRRIDSLDISTDGKRIFVALDGGDIFVLRTRGAGRQYKDLPIGEDSVFDLAAFDLKNNKGEVSKLLAASDRGQKLKIYCQVPMVYSSAGVDVRDLNVTGIDNQKNKEIDILMPQITVNQSSSANGVNSSRAQVAALVAQSDRFKNPISIISKGVGGSVLWLAQKTGNLMVFDLENLLRDGVWGKRIENCPSQMIN